MFTFLKKGWKTEDGRRFAENGLYEVCDFVPINIIADNHK